MSIDREDLRSQIETSLKLKQCVEDIDKLAEKYRDDIIKLEARIAELESLATEIKAGSKASMYIALGIVSFIGWFISSLDTFKTLFSKH